MGAFIDFNHVKSNADVAAVLEALNIEGRQSGDEIRIRCVEPSHDDNRASCDVNVVKKTFYCHSCHATGSILDLVALAQDIDTRGAAEFVANACQISLSDRAHPPSPERKAGRMKPGMRSEPSDKAADDAPAPAGAGEFEPFTTVLKLDAAHAYGSQRALDPAIVAEFAMGFQSKGMFKGRWCIPIHDRGGGQLGYCGRWTGKRLPDDTERWLFPKHFPKSEVLFNLHRAGNAEAAIVLVEGPFDAIHLHQFGIPAVAVMGTSVSEAQLDLLEGCGVTQVALMMDGDAPGRKFVPKLLADIGERFFVRDIKLPDSHDPDDMTEDFLRESCWFL